MGAARRRPKPMMEVTLSRSEEKASLILEGEWFAGLAARIRAEVVAKDQNSTIGDMLHGMESLLNDARKRVLNRMDIRVLDVERGNEGEVWVSKANKKALQEALSTISKDWAQNTIRVLAQNAGLANREDVISGQIAAAIQAAFRHVGFKTYEEKR